MKNFLVLIAIALTTNVKGQSVEGNQKHVQFINAEHPIEGIFTLKGDLLCINVGKQELCMSIHSVTYKIKYSFSQGDGQNFWFLVIDCRDNKNCVTPTGNKSFELCLSEHKERAENILRALESIK